MMLSRWMYTGLRALSLLALCLMACLDVQPARAEELASPKMPPTWGACWVERGGLPLQQVVAAEVLLGVGRCPTDLTLRVPYRRARATLTEANAARILPEVLLRYEVPLWTSVPLSTRVVPGETLSLAHGLNACLPYPLRSVVASSQPVVRGRTQLLVIETDRLAFCQVEVFEQSIPCYRDGALRHYALVGVPAFVEPGSYPMRVEVVSGEEDLTLWLDLEIAAGHYGYQVITPPSHLQALLDAELMESEELFLAPWRGLRSLDRYWDYPLQSPLQPPMSISAAYGDRRSYGGIVESNHSGVDYRAVVGTPVMAPEDGVVVMVESLARRGNAVLIDHGWGLVTGYWHLSRVDVEPGDVVRKGETFAAVGNTGLSTGAHLHWEVWVNGVSVDGRQWLDHGGFGDVELAPPEPLLDEP